jgi:uncharacterized protein (DUF305 family)
VAQATPRPTEEGSCRAGSQGGRSSWRCWRLVAAPIPLAGSPTAAATDQTDVWFMQHMIPHLWQTSSIAFLTRDQITHPELARLADTITRRDQGDIDQLQGWLSLQGLAPHGHSHQRIETREQTDLERLSRLRGIALDLALLEVMTARERAGITMAATEARHGTRPDVRQLARRMLVQQRADIRQMDAWNKAWATAGWRSHPGRAPG